ncbi:Neutral and basic amino acid transport protein rBAT [Cichlidogyrus casuarinus]|uniref:Neutral and basic amino acid transport protein rBAT n=1 Tax=Cichlidogyrus casuarinus TaxID=1844966 RepID=A0ABD2Q9B4_9PLAT
MKSSKVEGYELGSKSSHELESATLLSSQKSNNKEFPTLLSREDLIRIEQTEPIWKRIRIAIFVLFWIIWIGLLVTTILLVVFSHKCPNKPDLPFYKAKVGYWIDPYAFKDSDGNGIGDLPGLISKMDYIKDVLNAGYIILDSLFTGFSTSAKYLNSYSSWTTIDPLLAPENYFGTMVKKLRRLGVELVVAIDFNSLLSDSTLLKELQNPTSKVPGSGLISRLGNPITGSAYSVYGGSSGLVDVDLTNNQVIEAAKAAVVEILKLGASGILLKDAAFFSEGKSDYDNTNKMNNSLKWFAKYQSQLMFANSSRAFVEHLKQAVQEAQHITGQHKLLILEAGNLGFGLPQGSMDPTEMFLSEDQADMIVGRHFVKQRGWHAATTDPKVMQPSLAAYLECTSNQTRQNIFLTTATSHDAPQASVYATAMSFLLPGSSLVYYGSEINAEFKTTAPPTGVYPKGKLPLCEEGETCPIGSHLPMLWDDNGIVFSDDPNIQKAYADFFTKSVGKLTSTVQFATSKGRDKDTIFDLVQKMVQLRNSEPSIQWGGDVNVVAAYKNSQEVEVFSRWGGYGQSPILTVVIKQGMGLMMDLTMANCSDSKLLYSFPKSASLEEGLKLDSHVFLKKMHDGQAGKDATIYLIKCPAKWE